MDFYKLDEKLKELKRKRVDVSIKSRKLADREIQEVSANRKPRVYSMEDVNDADESVGDTESPEKRKHFITQSKNMMRGNVGILKGRLGKAKEVEFPMINLQN